PSGSTRGRTARSGSRTSSSHAHSRKSTSRTATSSSPVDTTGRSGAAWRGGRTSRRHGGSSMARAARVLFASTTSFAVVVAAIGWLYVVQPHSALPGPAVQDALPLDELSRRSAVPLLLFLLLLGPAAPFLPFLPPP